jgi:acetylornithine deacetylase/succinyl-diaminopimelate desuccinylase-like protein
MEPTGLDVYLGNRGVAHCEIVVTGRGGHAGPARVARVAIPAALALATALGELPLTPATRASTLRRHRWP